MPTARRRRDESVKRDLAALQGAVLIEHNNDVVTITDAGLRTIEVLAKAGSTQNYIASQLGITANTFKKILGRSDSDDSKARLAYEKGRADHEQDVVNRLLAHGVKNPISLIFYSKAKLGWKENEPPPAQQTNIVLTLPRPLTREEYYRSLSISGPIDSRVRDVTPTKSANSVADTGLP